MLQKFDPNTASDGYIVRREKRLSTSGYRHTRAAVFIDRFAAALYILGGDSQSKRSKKPKRKNKYVATQ